MQKYTPLSLLTLVLVSLQAFAIDDSNENFMRQIASQIVPVDPDFTGFGYPTPKHDHHRGRMAIEQYKKQYPKVYVQNTSHEEQSSIATLYEKIRNGERLDQFLKSENLKDKIHAVVPSISLLCNTPSESPIMLKSLAVDLAREASLINKKNNEYKQSRIIHYATLSGLIASFLSQ